MFDVVDGSWNVGGIFILDQTSTSANARIRHGHHTDASNYYYVSLRTSNELSLRKVVNGVITELARVPLTPQYSQPYRLRSEAIGTKLIDEVRLQASDASHPLGRNGLVIPGRGFVQRSGSHKAARKQLQPGRRMGREEVVMPPFST